MTTVKGRDNMNESLPREFSLWKASGSDEIYTPQTIFDHMDGAAEIYLAYNLKGLLVRRFVRPKHPQIVLEVFKMGSSRDAFGVFTHTQGRDEKDRGIGQGSEYRGGLLCFWKREFFVCILAKKETPETKKTVLALGKAVAEAIREEGKKPEILKFLPEKGLIEKSIRYFHKDSILNYHYYVADQNIFNLNEDVDAVLVRYEDKSYLLLIQYRCNEEAKAAFEGFVNAYMPDARERGIILTENGRWTMAIHEKSFVAVVFDALSKEDVASKIETVRKRLK